MSDLKLELEPEEIVDEEGAILWLTKMVLVIGGVIPFIPQYLKILSTRDVTGFSTMVCFVVTSSSVLRIAYWFGHWFDITLLIQSFVMASAMLILMELCVRVEREQTVAAGRTVQESNFLDFDPTMFWRWTNISSYVEATMTFLVVFVSFAIMFSEVGSLIEPIGFIALLIEAGLGLPQFITNYQAHSTEGMSIYMVIFWTVGDAVKAFFFFHTGQPIPFRMCATIQLILDFALFGQVALYSH